MFFTFTKKSILTFFCIFIFLCILFVVVRGNRTCHLFVSVDEELSEGVGHSADPEEENTNEYIKWVTFDATYQMLSKALEYDIKSKATDVHLNWIELLAYSVAKNWGNVDKKCLKYIDECVKEIHNGSSIPILTRDLKYYDYYLNAYTSILGSFVGEYEVEVENDAGGKEFVKKYGLKVFSPIAKGYGFSHYKDFGAQRTYGYSRPHLGNDLIASVGTPIIAVEGGVIEAMGWNKYGGWRIGVRSHDKKRYYYYAHLKKNHPFNKSLKEGDSVKAGDVIGYLGMTGYSNTENVNNITTPHLHFGLQLIFDEVQKEGVNQIWIDVYNIVELLNRNRSAVYKDPETNDYFRKYDIKEIKVAGEV